MGIKDSMNFIFEKLLRFYRTPMRLEEQMRMMNKRQEMMFWWMMRKENESLRETQKRFFASLPPAEGQLRTIQNALLELLKKFDDFCTANQVVYWLDFGTLIGAVRHHGFVPWDDDLDICMTRKNFYKLCDLLEDSSDMEIKNYFYIRCVGSDKQVGFWPKLISKKQALPVCVDIYIRDEVFCNNAQECDEKWKKRSQLRKECMSKIQSHFKKHIFAGFLDSAEDNRFLRNIYSEYAKKLSDSNGNHVIVGIEFLYDQYSRIRVYPNTWFSPAVPCEFEGRQFPIPPAAEQYLTMVYGDIYGLPLDAGYSHHLEDSAELQKQIAMSLLQ